MLDIPFDADETKRLALLCATKDLFPRATPTELLDLAGSVARFVLLGEVVAAPITFQDYVRFVPSGLMAAPKPDTYRYYRKGSDLFYRARIGAAPESWAEVKFGGEYVPSTVHRSSALTGPRFVPVQPPAGGPR